MKAASGIMASATNRETPKPLFSVSLGRLPASFTVIPPCLLPHPIQNLTLSIRPNLSAINSPPPHFQHPSSRRLCRSRRSPQASLATPRKTCRDRTLTDALGDRQVCVLLCAKTHPRPIFPSRFHPTTSVALSLILPSRAENPRTFPSQPHKPLRFRELKITRNPGLTVLQRVWD